MRWIVRAGMLLTNATILVDLQFDLWPCITWGVSSVVVICVATILTKTRNPEENDTGIICRSEVPPLEVKTDAMEISSVFMFDTVHGNRGVENTKDNTQLPSGFEGNEPMNLPDMQCDHDSRHTNHTACGQNRFPLYATTGIGENTNADDIELDNLFADNVMQNACDAKTIQC